MNWVDGSPCSVCGKPTVNELHTLTYSRREYRAPLYHIEQYNVGFCGPYCSNAWMKQHRLNTVKAS